MSDDKVRAWIEAARRDGDDEAANAIEALLRRCEKAEQEREETLRMWREYKAAKDAGVAQADAARERAEADNAALLKVARAIDARRHELLDALYSATDDMPYGRNRDAAVDAWAKPGPSAIPDGPHPGAALLERLRSLEKENETKRALLENVARACRGLGPVTPDVEAVVGRALEIS